MESDTASISTALTLTGDSDATSNNTQRPIYNRNSDDPQPESGPGALSLVSTPTNYSIVSDQSDAATLAKHRYGTGPRRTLPLYSTLFKSGISVFESDSQSINSKHTEPYIQCSVPTHIPFSRSSSKTPYMLVCLYGQKECKIWQKILSNDQILYTLEFDGEITEKRQVNMLNTGSKGITELVLDGRRLTWYGTPGLASTFGSGFFELLDDEREPVALYYSIASKALAKTKKVGEFVIWESEMDLAPVIVAMGLALREQEQRKNFERSHIVVRGSQ